MTTQGTTPTTATADERIARLEAQITTLEDEQGELTAQLRRARLEQWQGRIDDLEVQVHLGALEANERVTALTDQLRTRWAAARTQLEGAPSTAYDVADTLRTGVEMAYADLRAALLESRQKVSHT